ncbi:MAG: hypothetical protein IKK84_03880 [Clostridia bacterium]|nr:hypothetical protein [Clostridia bacterium]
MITLRIIGLVITVLVGMGINYFVLPAWNLRNPSLWSFLIVISIIGAIIECVIESSSKNSKKKVKHKYIGTQATLIVAGTLFVILLLGFVTSWPMFSASKYQAMTDIKEGNFEQDINQVDNVSNISIVDMETAEHLGDRTIGSIKNSAWYEVDNEYNLIKYNGGLYRISSLNYGGFFKYNKANKTGIPGYVLVNTSTQEAKYIELKDGIKYSPSAYWSYDLKRHLRNEYPSYIFGKSFFEIDEEGIPYYITSVINPTIGMFGGQKEETFIITNATSGECKEYTSDQLPEWVDHAYSLDYLMRITENNLTYINGFWNSIFSQTNVLKTTYFYRNMEIGFEGYNTAITSNGEIVFYTGLTPASNAESNVGFILANPKTGEVIRYNCSGAEESSAQASAESLVQDLRYVATFPTILNVNGEETYFMLLKDKAGLVQRYALCNVKNYTKVVQAETLKGAVNLYLEKLGVENNQNKEIQNISGKITELYNAEIDGNTYYYFKLENSDNLYMSSIQNSNKQVLLKIGTKINIEYVTTSEIGVCLVQNIVF